MPTGELGGGEGGEGEGHGEGSARADATEPSEESVGGASASLWPELEQHRQERLRLEARVDAISSAIAPTGSHA